MKNLRSRLAWAAVAGALLLLLGLSPTVLAQGQSTDATLSGLTLSDVDFGTFASGTTSYTASVASTVKETTVTPTTNHSGASYVIKLGGVTDDDGEVSLSVGSSVITVEVTAEDGQTTQTYTVTVTRTASTDATLSDLALQAGRRNPYGTNYFGLISPEIEFDSDTNHYTANVSSGRPHAIVTPVVNHSGASYVITFDDAEDADGEIRLSEGSNVITIEVTAEDGETTQTYTLTVTRAVNVPATGTPIISGTAAVGETLTLDISSIDDEEGIDIDGGWNHQTFEIDWDGPCHRYSWLQREQIFLDPNDKYYGNLEALSLLVPPEAAGGTITATVLFTDEEGYSEVVRSDPTAVVPKSIEGLTLVDTSDQSDVETVNWNCDGDHTQDVVLDADGSYSFRVKLASNAEVDSVSWDLNDGAFTRTDEAAPYSLYGEDEDSNLEGRSLAAGSHTVEATAYSSDDQVLQTFSATFAVTHDTPATGVPTISGTAQVGQTLIASTSDISDADGLTNVSYSYQWLADDTEIDGATSSTHTLQSSDNGRVIKVRVDFKDDAKTRESLTSEGTAAVVMGGL